MRIILSYIKLRTRYECLIKLTSGVYKMWSTDYENLLNALRNVGFIVDEYGLKPDLTENSGKSIHIKLRVKTKNLPFGEVLTLSHRQMDKHELKQHYFVVCKGGLKTGAERLDLQRLKPGRREWLFVNMVISP